MAANDKSLKIASRLVCTDQWLVTHVDPSWPILYLKQYLLHKFQNVADDEQNPRAIPVSPRKTRRRSLSPITFAPPTRKALVPHSSSEESSLSDFGADVDLDDDDVNITKTLADAHRYKYNARPSTSSASDSAGRLLSQGGPDPQAYVLLTFSTTQILEDRFSLSWYGVHPNELLELHPVSLSFVSLQRSSLDAYIAPYFATRVWALRVVGNRLETAPSFMCNRPGEDESVPDPKSSSTRDKGKRKVAVEWKERWAIVHHGVFSLCKERHDTHVAFSAPFSTLLSIHDSAHLTLPFQARRLRHKSSSSSNVVCVKFSVSPGPRQRTFSNESHSVAFHLHHPQPPSAYSNSSSGQGAWWRRGSRDVSSALSLGLTSSASVLVGSGSVADVWDTLARKGSRVGPEDLESDALAREKWRGKEREEREDAVWIVLDMLDSSACSHILRILHRHAPPTCRSTFLPSRSPPMSSPVPSPIIFSSRTSTPITPSSPITPGPSSSFTFPPLPVSPTTITPSPLSSPTPHSAGDSYAVPSDEKSPAYRPAIMLPRIDTSVSAPAAGVPYPSWRLSIVRNARRAGLGSVGRAMELVMFGDEDEDEFADVEDVGEEDDLVIKWARRTSSVDPSPIEPLRSAISTRRSRPQLKLPPRHFSDPSVLSLKSSVEEGSAPDPGSESQPDPQYTHISDTDRDPDPLSVHDAHPLSQRQSHPLVDLTSLHDTEHDPYHDSDKSEVEWDGWVDAVVEQHKQESILAQTCAQQAHPAKIFAPVRKVGASGSGSGSGGESWAEGWSTRFGGSRVGTPSPAASMSTSDRDPRDEEGGNWNWPRGSDAEADTEGSEAHSSDPNAPPMSSQRRVTTGTRGRKANPGNAQQGPGRTLSTYSSVDSLLRRTMTMRTNIQTIKSISLTQAKRASMHVLFPSASRSDANLNGDVPQRAASASPPPVTHQLSRPSMASMRSAGSMGSWTRPLSPLSSQVGREDDYDEDDGDGDADADPDAEDVDNVEEDFEGDGTGYVESELGHDPNLSGGYHPIPLPGMRMVPAGYTTFQHSALYGMQGSQREGEGEGMHAGIVHGQSMQRLPMGMSSMMTTVSSTVSVGPSARRSRAR